MTAGPISRLGAYAVVAAVVVYMAAATYRLLGTEDGWLLLVVAAVITTPVWAWASILGAVVSLEEQGVRSRSLVGTSELPWDQARRVHGRSGLYGYRQIVVHGRRRKMAVSTNMPGFAPLARALLAEAGRRGVPVTLDFDGDPEAWLEGARSR